MTGLTILSKPFSRFTKAWNAVVARMKELFDDPAVPYVVTYKAASPIQIPADFDVSRYKGLAICHVTGGGGGFSQLLTYWDAEPCYVAQGGGLELELKLPAAESKGLLADFRAPKEEWWKRLSVKDWIITAAALVTALTLLRGELASLVEAPQAQVAFTDLAPIDVTSGMPVSAEVQILNDSTYAKTTVQTIKGLAAARDAGRKVMLTSDPPSLPPLSVGESRKVLLSGMAPQRQSEHGPPETYDMTVSISARTGVLRGSRLKTTVASRRLIAWPSEIGWGQAQIQQGGAQGGNAQDFAQLAVIFFPGKAYPQGANGTVSVVTGPDEVLKLNVTGQVETYPDSPPGSSITHEVGFRSPPLERFKPWGMSIILDSSKPLAKSRWDELIKSIETLAQ